MAEVAYLGGMAFYGMVILQTLIVFGVMCVGIYYEWPGITPGIFGFIVAYLLTVPPLKLWYWFLTKRDRRILGREHLPD